HCTHLLADLNHLPYPAADVDDPEAILTVSDYRNGPRSMIPREQWRFASDLDGEVVADERYVYLPAGFEPGKVYDIVYTTEHAPVVGSGLLAVRDGTAFLRSTADENPLAGQIDWVIGFGVSQTARMLRHFLALGLNLDQSGQQVFDGVLPNVGGGRQGEFNHRFGQPSVQPTPSPGYAIPVDDAGLLQRQRAVGGVPKVMQTNSSAEYWRGDAALMHVALDGTRDLPSVAETPIYHFTGTQHDPGELCPGQTPLDGSAGRYRFNWVDYTPLLRAALVNLDRWVSEGIEPPPNVHPRLNDGTLVDRAEVLAQLVQLELPGLVLPDEDRLQRLWHVDAGPEAARGVVRFPVEITGACPALVAALDSDGNEVGGLRLPDLTQPLGTHTGWNPRHPDTGAPEQILDYKGATLLFPHTIAERDAAGDPRRSIEDRYPCRDVYLERVEIDARLLYSRGYLLEEDITVVLADAAARFDAVTQ
ncbi:MAG TPA: alpha/beta hydrolase domain-containing protein, partial [Chloroflexota bacterium]|nr:alpha/beta hydrolase domain-containing protein [Chloroflexota bacterium]